MIRSFKDKETELIFKGKYTKHIPHTILYRTYSKLKLLNVAISLDELRKIPGNRLELLKGDKAGIWSIRFNDQYRIIFVINEDGDFEDVELVDYH